MEQGLYLCNISSSQATRAQALEYCNGEEKEPSEDRRKLESKISQTERRIEREESRYKIEITLIVKSDWRIFTFFLYFVTFFLNSMLMKMKVFSGVFCMPDFWIKCLSQK